MTIGVLFALAAGLMWGIVFVGPLLLPEYPAALQSFGRYIAFGLIALPLAWIDRSRLAQLTREDELAIEAIIARSPVRIRISTCFGDRFPNLPRLVNTGDCGAGEDFLVVTSDRRTKACSFQSSTRAVTSPQGLVAEWQTRRRERARAVPWVCAAIVRHARLVPRRSRVAGVLVE